MKYSPIMSQDYFIGVNSGELERLREQHTAWRPETRALWAAAGFGQGQRLVDLGAGPGFSTLELAELVGDAGSVAALDKAAPYLTFLRREAGARKLGNIVTIDSELIATGFSEGEFDGAFCRFFLAFLALDLERALACIHRSLKPGGVLAAMEYLTLSSATSMPPMPGFDAHTEAWMRYYEKHGADAAIGRRLPQALARAGFEIEHLSCAGGLAGPDHRWWAWWGRLIEDFGEKLAADALIPHEVLRELQAAWKKHSGEPGSLIHTPLLLQVVARKTSGAAP